MIKAIKKCNNNKFRFIYFTFFYDFSSKIGHVNVVIIDLYKKTLELFEPYGYINKPSTNNVNRVFPKIMKRLDLDDFKFIPPSNLSPRLGIQSKGDCGMCLTIIMMYLHLRILNPDIKQTKIVNYLLSYNSKELKELILKYARHVERTLKNNSKLVKKFNKLFYEIKEDINI